MNKADNTKLLSLMRFWLFGTFVIVFVAITVYIGFFETWSNALVRGLPIWGITAILCLLAYYGYQWYLKRKG